MRSDRKRQIVRLINPDDYKVEFDIRLGSSMINKRLIISPKNGIIKPGGFIHINIENLDYETKASNFGRLYLVYWKKGYLGKNEHGKGIVPINMIAPQVESLEAKKETSFWLITRILRITFLVALIIYNMILIKLSLMS